MWLGIFYRVVAVLLGPNKLAEKWVFLFGFYGGWTDNKNWDTDLTETVNVYTSCENLGEGFIHEMTLQIRYWDPIYKVNLAWRLNFFSKQNQIWKKKKNLNSWRKRERGRKKVFQPVYIRSTFSGTKIFLKASSYSKAQQKQKKKLHFSVWRKTTFPAAQLCSIT